MEVYKIPKSEAALSELVGKVTMRLLVGVRLRLINAPVVQVCSLVFPLPDQLQELPHPHKPFCRFLVSLAFDIGIVQLNLHTKRKSGL